MVVHNASDPFMIHHESLYIEKVVNSRHKLLFTMGKDRALNENRQVSEEAYFIKIWDFMSLVEGTAAGCKFATILLVLLMAHFCLNIFRLATSNLWPERRHNLGETQDTEQRVRATTSSRHKG